MVGNGVFKRFPTSMERMIVLQKVNICTPHVTTMTDLIFFKGLIPRVHKGGVVPDFVV